VNTQAYTAICSEVIGALVRRMGTGIVRVSGRDRVSFLQGQVSNDVLQAAPGIAQHTCLLNNTGHLLADLQLASFDDHMLLLVDSTRTSFVVKTLERFVIREKVRFEDLTGRYDVISVVGTGSRAVVDSTLSGMNIEEVQLVQRMIYATRQCIDVIVPSSVSEEVMDTLLRQPRVLELDDVTANILRAEAGEPAWGSELDETIIPLEAGFADAISYTKGCYMGQEIIARIHSRGHTNRALVGFYIQEPVDDITLPMSVIGVDGEKNGQDVGRLTSFALSPKFGTIGLGYVRNEYSAFGTSMSVAERRAVVSDLPFGDSATTRTL
jgi:tRNA-modifying protein YgfZ